MTLLQAQATIPREGIHVAKEIAEKTVWDTLAVENPTHAVISAADEAEAARKSKAQIDHLTQFLRPDTVLLDCGTGYGRVAKYVLPEMKLSGYIGVDSAFEMLSIFRRRYKASEAEQRTPLLLLNADIHTLPLKDDSVDVVLVCAVFLHNHKSVVAKAMKEIKRVLKPGGKILVYSSFPRAATAMGAQGLLYQALLNLLGRPYKNGPVRYYRRKEVLSLFEGFSEVELWPVGYGLLPKTLIFLPGPLEKLWRVGFANPLNRLFERLTPAVLKPHFTVHYDVIATR